MSVSTKTERQIKSQPLAVPTEPVWRLTVEQYHQMIRSGILDSDDKVELLEGWLIPKMAKNPPHRAATKLTRNALEAIAPDGWYVDSQEPITLDDSEPEPDIVIVGGETRDYLDGHPGGPDVALVVEVADSTLERDRILKQRLYARAGIPVYWIVNLVEGQLEVYSRPVDLSSGPIYRQRQDYSPLDEVEVAIGHRTAGSLRVRDLLP
ncbi:MAG: Uma2 family endonuclease [Hormoscilla sp. GM102CHS1]|nr:Uma2 family endonuclease [Hormoscilla sp. GM102CHS1]